MAHPIVLKHLSPREAIADAIYRITLGFDTNDTELFKSAVDTNITFDRNGQLVEGLDAVVQNIFAPLAKLETHHSISSVRTDFEDGAKAAHAVTYTIAQHYREGEAMDPSKKGLMGGTMNRFDLVLHGKTGLWKITKCVMDIKWMEGDASIVGLPGL
jgi:hypothetical protein